MAGISEYIAVALIESAVRLEKGIAVPRDQLQSILKEQWGIDFGEEEISAAVRMLNSCDISYSEDDEFAGTFIVVSESRFKRFVERVVEQQSRYNAAIESDRDMNLGVNIAESLPLHYLEVYNRFSSLRKYSQFGAEWIELAMRRIGERSQDIPASDRVVEITDNDPKAGEIVVLAEQLERHIEAGNDFGELTSSQIAVAAIEVSQLKQSFSGRYLRREEILRRARSTLSWISEKAAGTVIGEAAKALFKAILSYFGMHS